MLPEDVPDELVEAAARATYAADPFYAPDWQGGGPIQWDNLDQVDRDEATGNARNALAAVLPDFAASVLVAAAVELWADPSAERGTTKAIYNAIYATWLEERAKEVVPITNTDR